MGEETTDSYIVILNFNLETHTCNMIYINRCREKGRDLTQSYDKAPTSREKSKQAM